jgi:hypothetical protein
MLYQELPKSWNDRHWYRHGYFLETEVLVPAYQFLAVAAQAPLFGLVSAEVGVRASVRIGDIAGKMRARQSEQRSGGIQLVGPRLHEISFHLGSNENIQGNNQRYCRRIKTYSAPIERRNRDKDRSRTAML